jgi:hypothetical protein
MTKELRQATRPDLDPADLGTPHFEDERTLLSARPVVPLEIVKAESKRRLLLFTTAVFVAILLGAASAVFVYSRLSLANVTETTVTQTDELSTGDTSTRNHAETTEESAGIAGEATEIGQPESSGTAAPEASASSQGNRRSPKRNQETQDQTISIREETRARRVSEAEELDREDLREARREARRETRREQRAAQRRERDNSDLLRIREIFEGSPTP